MADQWYYKQNNEQHGPISSEQLKQLAISWAAFSRPTRSASRGRISGFRPDGRRDFFRRHPPNFHRPNQSKNRTRHRQFLEPGQRHLLGLTLQNRTRRRCSSNSVSGTCFVWRCVVRHCPGIACRPSYETAQESDQSQRHDDYGRCCWRGSPAGARLLLEPERRQGTAKGNCDCLQSRVVAGCGPVSSLPRPCPDPLERRSP